MCWPGALNCSHNLLCSFLSFPAPTFGHLCFPPLLCSWCPPCGSSSHCVGVVGAFHSCVLLGTTLSLAWTLPPEKWATLCPYWGFYHCPSSLLVLSCSHPSFWRCSRRGVYVAGEGILGKGLSGSVRRQHEWHCTNMPGHFSSSPQIPGQNTCHPGLTLSSSSLPNEVMPLLGFATLELFSFFAQDHTWNLLLTTKHR